MFRKNLVVLFHSLLLYMTEGTYVFSKEFQPLYAVIDNIPAVFEEDLDYINGEATWQEKLSSAWIGHTWADIAQLSSHHGLENIVDMTQVVSMLSKLPISHAFTIDLIFETRLNINASRKVDFSLHGMTERNGLHNLANDPLLDDIINNSEMHSPWYVVRKWAEHQLNNKYNKYNDSTIKCADNICSVLPTNNLDTQSIKNDMKFILDFWLEFDTAFEEEAIRSNSHSVIPQPSIFVGISHRLKALFSTEGFSSVLSMMKSNKNNSNKKKDSDIVEVTKLIGYLLEDLLSPLLKNNPRISLALATVMSRMGVNITVYQIGIWLSRPVGNQVRLILQPDCRSEKFSSSKVRADLNSIGMNIDLIFSNSEIQVIEEVLTMLSYIGVGVQYSIDILLKSYIDGTTIMDKMDVCIEKHVNDVNSTCTYGYMYGSSIGFEIRVNEDKTSIPEKLIVKDEEDDTIITQYLWNLVFLFLGRRRNFIDLSRVNLDINDEEYTSSWSKYYVLVNMRNMKHHSTFGLNSTLEKEISQTLMEAESITKTKEQRTKSRQSGTQFLFNTAYHIIGLSNGDEVKTITITDINHIKIVFSPGKQPEVKLYTRSSVDHIDLYD